MPKLVLVTIQIWKSTREPLRPTLAYSDKYQTQTCIKHIERIVREFKIYILVLDIFTSMASIEDKNLEI